MPRISSSPILPILHAPSSCFSRRPCLVFELFGEGGQSLLLLRCQIDPLVLGVNRRQVERKRLVETEVDHSISASLSLGLSRPPSLAQAAGSQADALSRRTEGINLSDGYEHLSHRPM